MINFQTFYGIQRLNEVSENILRMFIAPQENQPAEAPVIWLGKPTLCVSQLRPPLSHFYVTVPSRQRIGRRDVSDVCGGPRHFSGLQAKKTQRNKINSRDTNLL